MAYFQFAMKQPNLFRQMFLLKRDKCPDSLMAINDALRTKVVLPLAEKTGVDAAQVETRCVKLWVFAHGLASLAAMGLLDMSEETVVEMINEAAQNYAIVN